MNETRGLWRGRGTNNWHYGDLIRAESENNHSPIIIENGVRYSVFPDTLGECTGLSDKNGKLIFEGDIVTYNKEDGGETREKGTVYWCDGAFWVENIQDEEDCGFLGAFVKYQLEIIGNIHDGGVGRDLERPSENGRHKAKSKTNF